MDRQLGALHCAESEKWLASQRETRDEVPFHATFRLCNFGEYAATRMHWERWLRFIAWWRELPSRRMAA